MKKPFELRVAQLRSTGTPAYPLLFFILVTLRPRVRTLNSTGIQKALNLNQTIVRSRGCYNDYKKQKKFFVCAATEGSAKSSESEETIPSWAKPDSDEPPPWAKGEGKENSPKQNFEVPFFVYLLASAITAIAAIGSIFEYVNQKPVFGIVNSDSIFYAPLLGFFAFTGIPTSPITLTDAFEKLLVKWHPMPELDMHKKLSVNQKLDENAQASDRYLKRENTSTRTCAEHKISVDDENAQKDQRLRRAQWLRAAILGANDGLLSTTSLMLGVGAAKEDRRSMVLSGLAGAVAGACSMAVGEFVSVSTQKDIEKETVSHFSSKYDGKDAPGIGLYGTATTEIIKGEAKLEDSKVISEPTHRMSRSMILEPKLPPGMSPGRSPVMKVIQEDGKRSPEILREDDGEEVLTNPYKAAVASGVSFLIGSSVPLLSAVLVAQNVVRMVVIAVVASIALACFGGFGAYLGGSPIRISAVRVLLGGWIAMAITFGLLKPFYKDHS
ncbi:hypothetical protein SADUNF_Sadunf11G0108000 [Salix dunnii]|uniref:Uncharacterized protein n=1 Tax=Salix dunnii TaxID=1413687 RepID=A0A835JR51_9ROSI|nr:hypothetical protein SADUNF_Sadunf11G0108000 [Salix dunnii]